MSSTKPVKPGVHSPQFTKPPTKPQAISLHPPVAANPKDDQHEDEQEDMNSKEVHDLTNKYLERIASKQDRNQPEEEHTGITDDEGSDDDDDKYEVFSRRTIKGRSAALQEVITSMKKMGELDAEPSGTQ